MTFDNIDIKDPNELKKYLTKVNKHFDLKPFLDQEIKPQDVINYYQGSNLGFRIFHSSNGSIHMALNPDGNFNKDGYFGQAQVIQEVISKMRVERVLELASGKGFNSIYLAKQNPDVHFLGIDLTPEHVEYSKRKAHRIVNIEFQQGNFQEKNYQDTCFDVVFEIESMCHATDMEKALSETYRILRPGGRFIVIDGFRSADFDSFTIDLKTAAKLTESSMAVGKPWKINEWTSLCEKVGFKVEIMEDLSMAIMPNLLRFQYFARGFLKYPTISKILIKILPFYLVQNAIAGVFMPFTISAGLHRYYKIIQKRG